MSKKKNIMWVNFYDKNCTYNYPFNTREKADKAADHGNRIACIQVEFERGDGLAHGRLMK